MLIREFIDKFEEIIPIGLQEEWDNSGLQLGNADDELKGIITCVDLTEEVIDQAIEEGDNLILAHHPVLFIPTKTLSYDYFIAKKLIKAIKNDIAVYASHTAIDVNKYGLNQFVFKEMGFRPIDKLVEKEDGHGYGDIADMPSRKIRHLADQIKERLDLDHIVFYGDEDREVSRVALVTGSGGEFIKDCLDKDIELYITSDIKHHDAMDALEQGLMIMDLGHYQSEKFFNELVIQISAKITDQVKITREKQEDRYRRNII